MALTVGLAAQAGSQNSSLSPTSRISVIGCLELTASSKGASGPAGATDGDTPFHLTKAAPSPMPAGAAAPPTGLMGTIYRLDAQDTVLRPFLGQKVEISGPARASSNGPASPSAASPSATAPTLTVDAIRMVASTCVE
jgi:hypothetical protein